MELAVAALVSCVIAADKQVPAKRARVRRSGDRVTVTDGPFTEAKEIVGGFAIVKAKSKAEAIEWAKRFLDVAGNGESEILQLHEEAALDQQ
jgi:hypothetical protein